MHDLLSVNTNLKQNKHIKVKEWATVELTLDDIRYIVY